MAILMTAEKLIERAKAIQKTPTVYMWGTYGQLLTNDLIDYKAKQYPSKNTPARVARHKKLVGQGYSAWDCVGLIKGILWGWEEGKSPKYKGTEVPDVGSDSMYKNHTTNQSTDFKNILPGEVVWFAGHIGVYIGDGLVIEATSRATDGFTDNVCISALGNIGKVAGYPVRSWTHHGRLKWVDYTEVPVPEPTPEPEKPDDYIFHTVIKGDTLWGIAKTYLGDGNRYKDLKEWNSLKSDTIYAGQIIKIYTKLDEEPPCDAPAGDFFEYTVKKGDTPWELAKKYLGAGNRYGEIMELSGLKKDDTIYVGQILKIPTEGEVTPPTEYKVRVTTKNKLNVRTLPTTASKRKRLLATGTVITISKEEKEGARVWGYVEQYDGWVALEFTAKA